MVYKQDKKAPFIREAIEIVGLKNVVEGDHKGLYTGFDGTALLWNPDVIFSQYPEFLQTLKDNPQWQQLSAVKMDTFFNSE